jgi:branched-chain amino acid transport system permease protein
LRLVSLGFLAVPLVAFLAYPLVAEQGYLTYVLIIILSYSIIALYYNMLLGYLGIPFLAPLVPYAVGGYTVGYLTLNGWNPFAGLLVGCVLAAGSGFAFSLLSMRLRGLYMALYSLVFTLFFQSLIIRQDVPALFNVFVGAIGQSNIPDINLGGFQWRLHDGVAYYYFALAMLVLSAIVLNKVLGSRFGIAFKAVRDAEVYAASVGVGIFRVKVVAFAISCFFIGLAGGLLTLFLGAIGNTILDTSNMLLFFSMVVIGGLGTFFGPVLGAFILVPLNSYLTESGPLRFLVQGLAVLLVVLIFPEGIVGRLQRFVRGRMKVPTGSAVS